MTILNRKIQPKLIIFFFIYELLQKINCNYLSMNFSSINYSKNNTYDFMSIIFNNELYIDLSIGTPNQKLKIILRGNEQTFYITEKTYNHSLSSTYKGEKNRGVFFLDNVQQGLMSNDTGHFNIKTKDNIITNETCLKYALVYSVKYDIHKKIDGQIGLQLKVPNYIGIPNFIDNLKSEKFINNYQWALLYNKKKDNSQKDNTIWNKLLYSDINGDFILGFNQDEINDIFNFNKKYEIRRAKAEKEKDKLFWSLYFEDIYLVDSRITDQNIIINDDEDTNKKYLKNNLAEFLLTKEYNIGTREFQLLINEEFFNYYLDNDICKINNIINDYSYEKFSYYICENTTGNFILNNKFPNIIFFHHDLNYTFELTYEDLFYTDSNDSSLNIFYFNIIFSSYYRDKWSLGIPFLKKYLFMFEYDQKLIELLILKNDDIIENNSTNNSLIITIIIISVLLIILGILIFLGGTYLGKKYAIYKRKNKKIADELEDEIISEKNIN